MERQISSRLTFTPDDSIRVAKFLRNQSFIFRHDVLLTSGIVFVSFIVAIVLMADDTRAINIVGAAVFSSVPAISVGLVVLSLRQVFYPWFMRRTIIKYFESSPIINKETQFTFSVEGISVQNELAQSFSKWPAIVSVVESKSDILFYFGHTIGWFIPKSAFESVDDLVSLRDLLRRSLTTNLHLL